MTSGGTGEMEPLASVELGEVNEASIAMRRERGMNDLASVIQFIYGDRCTRREGGCTCCAVWAVYDALDTMTDASVLADELERRQP